MSTSVRIIGTGLIGTSLGIALSSAGFAVTLEDPSPTAVRLARDLRAGSLATETDADPDIVVVGAPPDVTAQVVVDALSRWPHAVVTDVASVKESVLRDVLASGVDATRYVGSHPMAGRERSGAAAARGDLFDGRAWVVVPHPDTTEESVRRVRELALAVGAAVRVMPAHEHDEAVAAVSHVPQLAASIVASCLRELPESAVGLAGQGLRDVTRIAASDPRLWTQILAGNAAAVRDVLRHVRDQVDDVVTALDGIVERDGAGSLGTLSHVLEAGNLGHARIPGKHGAAPAAYVVVSVVVPDEPGALARLLGDIGSAGINLEDLHLEHGLGQAVGVAEVSVVPASVEPLRTELARLGWRVHD
ncbi:prephenate dehydrogenase [Intrasporangium oryzae NRRL B-24470]|uniref:Prephenate dehydrogenase n=1 Tax=Intrasporangium oryzae NRRL B-24470 TaxID=1386089 RepID=W9G676_9MICO|nr:prephenate dehydrogenase [Intrasporangium oryzae]EWT01676.1 prephenate dehydrogenase [Intrasporangium oryzae NRRL B-24470]